MSSTSAAPILEIKNLEIRYGGPPIIFDFSLKVGVGEILSIVGESGSGKSTLINAVMGLLGNEGQVTNGEILFKGNNLLDVNSDTLRRMRGPEMGMVFQNHASSMCPIRTIGEQFFEAVREHKKTCREEVKQLARALFEKINLKDGDRILESYPFELSGGMIQRVGIAMAMLLNPELLFADEPTSALDVVVKAMVAKELVKLRDEKNTTVMMVTHDIGLAASLSETIVVMNHGRLVEYGPTASVINAPQHNYTKSLIQAVPRLVKR